MAKSNKGLVNLALGGNKKTTPAKKKEVVVEKKLTPEEERDLKAKETVKELLSDVDLSITTKPKEDDLLEVDDTAPNPPNGNNVWLQEQVAALTSENELLKGELAVAKGDYQRIFNENMRIKAGEGLQNVDELKRGVLTVFHEIQSQYMKNPGFTPYGTPNFVIVPAAFLNRLIVFFPFLAKEKRF
jgi:hypothetical protein